MSNLLGENYAATVPNGYVMAHMLQDTINHYGAAPIERRLVGSLYESWGDRVCALGRYCDVAALKRAGVSPAKASANILRDRYKSEFLAPRIQSIPNTFLVQLAELHDTDYYWTSRGLSRSGKYFVQSIITQHRITQPAELIGLVTQIA